MTKAYDAPPSNKRAVEARTRNLARDRGEEERRAAHRLAVVVLVDMLSAVPGSAPPVIKGGSALMFRLGTMSARLSRDLDAVVQGDLREYQDVLTRHGRTPHHGWTYTIAKPEEIANAAAATAQTPRRMQVKLSYHGRPYATVQLELAVAEGDSMDGIDLVTVPDLADLGFGRQVTVPLLGVPYQAAQKLHACTEHHPDRPNPRARDLVDLALLHGQIRARLPETFDACRAVFDERRQHPWPPRVRPEHTWGDLYATARESCGVPDQVPEHLDDAVDLINTLITDIHVARLNP